MSAHSRTHRRSGALAMLAHCFMGAALPVNPWPPSDQRHFYYQWGMDAARRFARPLMDQTLEHTLDQTLELAR